MWHLYLRMAARRITALLAIACAVFGGAALVTGTGVLAESGVRSHLPVGRLAGADVVVSANQTVHPPEDVAIALPERRAISSDLISRLDRLPGVEEAVGVVSFPAAVVDDRGHVVSSDAPQVSGHGWSSTKLLGGTKISGEKPDGAQEVAVGGDLARAAGVGAGDRVQVAAAGRTATYRVSAVIAGGSAAADAGILFDDTTAAGLAGRNREAGSVDLVGLRTAPGKAESVAAGADRLLHGQHLVVSTGAARGDVADTAASASRSLLILLAGSLAGVTLLIVGFVVAGALAVSLTGQRRELALMRAVGATPHQIRRLAAGQATVVASAAIVPGVALGYLLAGRFRDLLVHVGLLPAGLPLTLSPLPGLAALLLLLVVVQVAARAITWRTSRMSATAAVAESRSERRSPSLIRTRVGLLLIVAATTLSVVPLLVRTPIGAAATSMAGILAAIGLTVAGPGLVRRLSDLLAERRPASVTGSVSAPGWLAMANVHAYPIRLAGAVTTLAMAVVFTLTYVFSLTTVAGAVEREVSSGTVAQVSITASALGGLPEGLVQEVRDVPGVRGASSLTSTTVVWSQRVLGDEEVDSAPAMILGPGADGVLDLDVRAGSLNRLTGDTVAVGEDVARSRHTGVGHSIDLVLGDGTHAKAKVAAVYARSLGFGPVVLSRDLAAGHTTSGLDQSLLVRTNGKAATAAALAKLAATHPGVRTKETGATPTGAATMAPEAWVNLATIAVLLGYLLLGVANSLVAATSQRSGEFATLRLNGATPSQVRMMMRREAAFVAITAVVSGLALSAIPLALLGIGFLHRPWPAGPFWLAPATVVVVAALAFVTVELPTRLALRTSPTQALADA